MGYSQNAQLLLYYQEILDLGKYFYSIHKTYNLILNFSRFSMENKMYDIDLIKKYLICFFGELEREKIPNEIKIAFYEIINMPRDINSEYHFENFKAVFDIEKAKNKDWAQEQEETFLKEIWPILERVIKIEKDSIYYVDEEKYIDLINPYFFEGMFSYQYDSSTFKQKLKEYKKIISSNTYY